MNFPMLAALVFLPKTPNCLSKYELRQVASREGTSTSKKATHACDEQATQGTEPNCLSSTRML